MMLKLKNLIAAVIIVHNGNKKYWVRQSTQSTKVLYKDGGIVLQTVTSRCRTKQTN